MQPFILLEIGIVNQDKEEKVVVARVQPENIDYYYPGFFNGTIIVNKSGNSFLTPLSVDQVDKVLKNYHTVSRKGKFGILEVQIN